MSDQLRVQGAALKSSGARGMVGGIVIIAIGVVITAVTYGRASGGTYIFAWGPILFGIVTFFRSLVQYVRGASALRRAGEAAPQSAPTYVAPSTAATQPLVSPPAATPTASAPAFPTQMNAAPGVPGWYPDGGRTLLRYWNGSTFDGQPWRPGLDEMLHEVTLVQVGSKLALRYALMDRLGVSEKEAKQYTNSAPVTIVQHLSLDLAQTLSDSLKNVNAVVEIKPQFPAAVLLTGIPHTPAIVRSAVSASPSAPPSVPPESMASAEVEARQRDPRFDLVESEYAIYKARVDAGEIAPAELDRLLTSLSFESGGRFWMIGANTGRWYASHGDSWVPENPPAKED